MRADVAVGLGLLLVGAAAGAGAVLMGRKESRELGPADAEPASYPARADLYQLKARGGAVWEEFGHGATVLPASLLETVREGVTPHSSEPIDSRAYWDAMRAEAMAYAYGTNSAWLLVADPLPKAFWLLVPRAP